MTVKTVELKNGRRKLKIIQSFRRPSDDKPSTTVIKDLGFVDDIEKEHGDAYLWAQQEAERLTREHEAKKLEYNITVNRLEHLPLSGEGMRKNLGYAALSRIYHELGIDEFWDNRRRYRRFSYNVNSIFKMLVYNRILYPSSKKGAWEERDMFFEDTDYTLSDLYNSLDYFQSFQEDLVKKLDEGVSKQYGRDTFLMHYDVTNYYFEIDENDLDEIDENGKVVSKGLRKKGCSKEHRTTPIIRMGLFMDRNGLPVTYDLFSGNTHDSQTLETLIKKAESHFKDTNLIFVADKGMMSGDNIRSIRARNQGYIISTSVRKSDAEFKKYVLDESSYKNIYDAETGELEFRIKSRLTPRMIKVSKIDGETGEKTGGKQGIVINERQIVVWSRKYAERERFNRGKVLEKAARLIDSHSSEATTVKFGSRKYIMKTPLKDGNPVCVDDYVVSLDEDLISEEEELDGYYAICTNVVGLTGDEDRDRKALRFFEENPQKDIYKGKDRFLVLRSGASDEWIMDSYHGLWRIEETFKVTKSGIQTRPVYAWTAKRIRAHFLICFTSLLILRILQYRLNWRYSDKAITESLRKASCTLAGTNVYVANHFDKTLEDIGNLVGIDFSLRYMTAGDIRKLIGSSKKDK